MYILIFVDYEQSLRANIICQICLQSKHAKKYKKHLYNHMWRGEVSQNCISEILFQSRFSRIDFSYTISLKTGVYCKVEGCNAVVLDLHRHLTVEYHLATSDLT